MNINDWLSIKRYKEIIEAGNLENARSKLKLSVAAIYNTFKYLEEYFGIKVVEKYQKGLFIPTSFGESLIDEYDKYLDILQNLDPAINKKQEEISISTFTVFASYILCFHLDNVFKILNLRRIKINNILENPQASLINSDILIFEKIKVTSKIEYIKLGNLNYKLYTSKDNLPNIKKQIKEKQIIDCIGCRDATYLLSEIDIFTSNIIEELTGKKPNLVIDTNSAINEYISCSKGLGIACLCSQSPFIKMMNLVPITENSINIPIYAYYKKHKRKDLNNLINLFKSFLV